MSNSTQFEKWGTYNTSGQFQLSVSTGFNQTYLLPGDTAIATVQVIHDTDSLAYYPIPIQIGVRMFSLDSIKVNYRTQAMVYFTPYNSVEIWDIDDFRDLPRRWEQISHPEPQRVYIPKTQVLPDTSIHIDSANASWQLNYRWKRITGLPYAIAQRAIHPDSVRSYEIQDSIIEVTYGDTTDGLGNFKTSHSNNYTFSISGNLSSNFYLDNANFSFKYFDSKDDLKQHCLSGLKVNLMRYRKNMPDQMVAECYSDQHGNYTFGTIANKHFPMSGGVIKLYLEVVSQGDEHVGDIKSFRRIIFGIHDLTKTDNFNNALTVTEDQAFTKSNYDFYVNNDDMGLMQAVHFATNAYRFMRNFYTTEFPDKLHLIKYRKNSLISDNGLLNLGFTSHYTKNAYGTPTIYLTDGDERLEDIVYHEFGHHVMWQMQDAGYLPVTRNHPWESAYLDMDAAWSEGWGYGFAGILDLAYAFQDNEYLICNAIPDDDGSGITKLENFERRNPLKYKGDAGLQAEYFIATMIYDLYDGPQPDHGNIQFSSSNDYNDLTITSGDNGYEYGKDQVQLNFKQIADVFIDLKNQNWPAEQFNVSSYMRWLMLQASNSNNWNLMKQLRVVFEQNGLFKGVPHKYHYSLHNKKHDFDFTYGFISNLSSQTNSDNTIGTDELGGAFTVYGDGGSETSNNLFFYDKPDNTGDLAAFFLNNSGTPPTSAPYNFKWYVKGFSATKKWISDPITISDRDLKINEIFQYNPGFSSPINTIVSGALDVHQIVDVTIAYPRSLSIGKDGNVTYNIESGSKLDLQGNLTIYDGSTLIVKSGSQLRVGTQNSIVLNGTNAKIIIENGGKLELAPNATFTFSGGSIGSGQINFVTSMQNGLINHIIAGSGSQFILQGNSNTDVVLEIDGTDALVPQPTLSLFKITNGAVMMQENTRMVLECPVYFNTVKWLTDNASHYNRGLQLFGYTHTLQNLEFWNGSPALFYNPMLGGIQTGNKNLVADQVAFKNCKVGLYTLGGGANLTNISGDATSTVWRALGMDQLSTATHFYDYSVAIPNTNINPMGIDFYGSSNSVLHLDDYTSAGGNLLRKKSIIFFGKNLAIKCSQINGFSQYGMYFYGHTLALSSQGYWSNSAGKNDISSSNGGIRLVTNEQIILYGGGNVLYNNNNDITGSSNGYHFWGIGPLANVIAKYPIAANNNFWKSNPNSPNSVTGVSVPSYAYNSSTTFTPTNTPILTFDDPSPMSAPTTTPMCGTSFDNGGTTHKVLKALHIDSVTAGIVSITTTQFSNVKLNTAIDLANIKLFIENDPATALDWYTQIILVNYASGISNENKQLLNYAYGRLWDALNKGLATGAIVFNTSGEPTNQFKSVLSCIHKQIAFQTGYTDNQYKYAAKYNYEVDRVMLWRTSKRYQTALDTLATMYSWIQTDNRDELDFYQCMMQKELKGFNGTYAAMQIQPAIDSCVWNIAPIPTKPVQSDWNLGIVGMDNLNIFPNPGNDHLVVAFDADPQSKVQVELFTADSRSVGMHWIAQNQVSGKFRYWLDTQNLPDGVYFIRINCGGEIKTSKWVKVKN